MSPKAIVSPRAGSCSSSPASPPSGLVSEGRWVWGKGKRSPAQAPELEPLVPSAASVEGLYPLQRPTHFMAAMHSMSPYKVPTPSPHPAMLSTPLTPALRCTRAASPRRQPHPTGPTREPHQGGDGDPRGTAVAGRPGERLGSCHPPRRCGGEELVRSALGARQGSAHRHHSAPRPCLPPPP